MFFFKTIFFFHNVCVDSFDIMGGVSEEETQDNSIFENEQIQKENIITIIKFDATHINSKTSQVNQYAYVNSKNNINI